MLRVLYFIYSLLWVIGLPFVMLRLLYRSFRVPGYRRRWGERLGFHALPVLKQSLWVHAVSVGEVVAAVPMILALKQRYPDKDIVVTTMTPTGSERVKALLQDKVHHVYVPYEVPFAIHRFLDRCDPALVVFIETELWPNIIRLCHKRSIPILIANARLSACSARGYAKAFPFTQALFKVIHVCAQHKSDYKRFRCLGVAPDRLSITGSIKYDIQMPKDSVNAQAFRQATQHRPLWVVASTHPGEDQLILSAFKTIVQSYPDLLLLLVPRHIERSPDLVSACQKQGLSVILRTDLKRLTKDTQVMVGNTMGEMHLFYQSAHLVFIGGSLTPIGGHNPLEPALYAKAILSGPHVFNFKAVFQALCRAKGARLIEEHQLLDATLALLGDKATRESMGHNAKRVLQRNQGALAKHLDKVAALLD